MTRPPEIEIDPSAFWEDPYPVYTKLRASAPIAYVPQLNAILFTRRDDIFTCEKNIDVFSSDQPEGLMTKLMGQNMMRKDGEPHQTERKQIFPATSPRTVRDVWKKQFEIETETILEHLEGREEIDLVDDFAMPVCGHALRHITGLTCLSAAEIDACSQAMIDGIGNYTGDPDVEARCHEATKKLDAAVDEMIGL